MHNKQFHLISTSRRALQSLSQRYALRSELARAPQSHVAGLLVLMSKILVAGILAQISSLVRAQEDDYINPDRPGIADGSTVVGAGRFQIESGIQEEYRRVASLNDYRLFVPTLLRVGLSERWEARVESNLYTWQRVSDPGNGFDRSQGASPVSVGMKYHFQDSNSTSQPSLGAILRIFPPSGSGEFRSRHTTGDFRLAADWDIAPKWSLNPNLGVGIYVDDQNRPFTAALFATTLNYNPSKTINFFVDTGVQLPEKKNGKSSIVYDAGIAFLVTHEIQLDFSAGTGTVGSTPPRTFISFGISMRY